MEITFGAWSPRTRIVAVLGLSVTAAVLPLLAWPGLTAYNALREAQVLLAAGQAGTAAELCQSVVRLNPRNSVARELLGACYYHQGRWDEAAIELRKATELGNIEPQSYALLARSCRQLGQLDEAEKTYQAALVAFPAHRMARKEYDSFREELRRAQLPPAPSWTSAD